MMDLRAATAVTLSTFALTLLAAPTVRAAEVDAPAAVTIREVVEQASHPLMRWGAAPHYQDEMLGLYRPGDFAPLWFADGVPRSQVRDVIDELLAAGTRGLDPDDYDAARLDAAWRAVAAGGRMSGRQEGLFDTAISLALLRHISDLHIGRINPKNLGVDMDIEHKKLDLAAVIRAAIDQDRIAATVAEAEPQIAPYRRIKAALELYARLAADASFQPLPAVPKVSPGDAWPGTPALRRLLVALGDLPAAEATVGDDTVYAGPLVDGVMRFQARHNLAADGVIGKATFEELNTPLAVRYRQLQLALERLRWLPGFGEGRLVVVNIPAFRLWAWELPNPDGRAALAMDVVVGRAYHTETPLFTRDMSHVVFYPFWNVPPSIARRDIVPKLKKDPGYLAAEGMELVDSYTQPAPSVTEVTPEVLDRLARGALKVRQRPGPKNALGPAKFIFPDSGNIYLHGTPARAAFGRPRRDLSSGCVRVADPAALAEFVLRGQTGWDREAIDRAMAGPREQWLRLERHVPVFLFYTTAYVEIDGTVHFLHDLYGHDGRLEAAIAAGEPFAP
ncbi:MAG: L,D-transpeptidase family protein [Thermoanaerobaculaceae bacterium]|jgi:murein L,D-transpeptidase YcbB/YkuD|nr:L,D-transpeptidase family protein [Thermoanaerobaculaceae bacterium]